MDDAAATWNRRMNGSAKACSTRRGSNNRKKYVISLVFTCPVSKLLRVSVCLVTVEI